MSSPELEKAAERLLETVGASGVLIIAVIAVGSVIALTILLARMWVLRPGSVLPRALAITVRDLVLREQIPEAMTLCRTDDSPLGRVYLAGLRQAGKRRDTVKEIVQETGRHETQLLLAGLGPLDLVAVISPLLGLFGTVWGMIDVFRTISAHGVGDPGALAGGIGTALYTTFAGLLVAIPARVAHSYLLGRVDGLVLALEGRALELVDLVAAPESATPSG